MVLNSEDDDSIILPNMSTRYLQEVTRKLHIEVPSEDNSEPESEPDEDTVTSDNNFPKIYVQQVLKNTTGASGQRKKHSRAFNVRHYCLYCKKMIQKWSRHVKVIHSAHPDIKPILELDAGKQQEKLLDTLRKKHDHAHNMQVLKAKRGEIILGRREAEDFYIGLYGPCPYCLLWVKKRRLDRHMDGCPSFPKGTKESKGTLLTESAVLLGEYSEVSGAFKTEVLSKMIVDQISEGAYIIGITKWTVSSLQLV